MHVIRPKSAKGRTRPTVTEAGPGDVKHVHEIRPFPPPPSYLPRPSPSPSHRLKSSPSPSAYVGPSKPTSAVKKPLGAPVLPLNKYQILPCIKKNTNESTRPRLHGHECSRSNQEMDRASSGTAKKILLALRTPCGERLMCEFRSTDTLRDVVAEVEAKSGTRYKHVQVNTMEVPLRSFTNLDMTLSQCGIVNKSVLCISFNDGI